MKALSPHLLGVLSAGGLQMSTSSRLASVAMALLAQDHPPAGTAHLQRLIIAWAPEPGLLSPIWDNSQRAILAPELLVRLTEAAILPGAVHFLPLPHLTSFLPLPHALVSGRSLINILYAKLSLEVCCSGGPRYTRGHLPPSVLQRSVSGLIISLCKWRKHSPRGLNNSP